MNDAVFIRLEEAALGAIADYMAYRTYQGDNPDYYKRARLGIPVLSTYGRVRGTRANERQLDIIERRIASGDLLPDGRPALAGSRAEDDPSDHESREGAVLVGAGRGARKAGRK